MKKTYYLIISALIVMASCNSKKNNDKFLDLSSVDKMVSPKDDFFNHSNGKWIEKTKIPDDQSRWGSFNVLRQDIDKKIKELISNAKIEDKNSDEAKALEYYKIAIDEEKKNKQGTLPIKNLLEQIDEIKTKKELAEFLASLHSKDISPFFNSGVYNDFDNSAINTYHIVQAGLSLPDRDYYIEQTDTKKEKRELYKKYLLDLTGIYEKEVNLNINTKKVYDIEYSLAEASMDKVSMRNIALRNNKFDVKGLKKIAPNFDWDTYFSKINIKNLDTIIVHQPEFIKKFNYIVNTKPLSEIKYYIKWHLINKSSSFLTKNILDIKFSFYNKNLFGQKEMKPLWQRAVKDVNSNIGFALGKIFVNKHFPESSKKAALELVQNLKKAFAKRLENIDWMGEETKKKAKSKLEKIDIKIGYPDKWETYKNVKVEGSHLSSYFSIKENEYIKNIKDYKKPVDRKKWYMTPQTVNAYYNPLSNEIVFPAAILQPPFFDANADLAINYGGIGMVIGHEITHGFDDSGSKFDENGNLKNWWTEEDRKLFDSKTKKIVDLFNSFKILDTIAVNGKLTLGENIADLGGINIAYDALQIALKEKNKENEKIDGMTQNERFFYSFAQIWKIKAKPEFEKMQVSTDPHSPAIYRVNGTLKNCEYFHKTFDVKDGDNMKNKEEDLAIIW